MYLGVNVEGLEAYVASTKSRDKTGNSNKP